MARHYKCPKCKHEGYLRDFALKCQICDSPDLMFEQEVVEYADTSHIVNYVAKFFGHVYSPSIENSAERKEKPNGKDE